MAFNPLGLLLGAALTRDVEDRARAAQIEVLGGVLGTTPVGLLVLGSMARQAAAETPPDATAPTEAAVPDVREAGDDLSAATETLTACGLVAAGTARVVSTAPQGVILGSTPEAGSVVALGTAVTINVSAGISVPAVTDKSVADAEDILGAAGFEVAIAATDIPGTPGVVVRQDPAAGKLASVGATVTLYANQLAKGGTSTRRSGPKS